MFQPRANRFSWDRLGLSTHDALGQREVAWTDKNGERYFDSRSQAGALWNEQRCLGVRRQEHPGHLYSSDKYAPLDFGGLVG
jgi:hypothetical protein